MSRIHTKQNSTIIYPVSRYPARTYGEMIRQKRLEMGLRQLDLAKLLGANETSVFNWENDRHLPSPAYGGKIWDALGVET